MHPIWPIFGADIQAHVRAVAGHGDIGQRIVHRARSQHIGFVQCEALGFVDGDGVTMIEGLELARVKGHARAVFEINIDLGVSRAAHRGQHAVLTPRARSLAVKTMRSPLASSRGP